MQRCMLSRSRGIGQLVSASSASCLHVGPQTGNVHRNDNRNLVVGKSQGMNFILIERR